MKFTVDHQDKKCSARACTITTAHGKIETPVFMPVGTHATVKSLTPQHLEDLQQKIILSNTYHLHLTPGSSLIKKLGGLHQFMKWPHSILTDSGGFQVFSLQGKKITEEGVIFKDQKGKKIALTPETSIAIQEELGSDIMMAFDECIPYPADRGYVEKSIARTHRWLSRCVTSWQRRENALFGIIQGSTYLELRKRCAEEVALFDLPGHAIGGVSVGEGPEHMQNIVAYTAPLMPYQKPRYVMGVGTPEDLLFLWEQGIDMSDCIIPTKYGRSGTLFTKYGRIRIRHKNYRHDKYPVDLSCQCYTCLNFSRAYLKHLFDANEILGQTLATIHNLAFYKNLATQARSAIMKNSFLSFKRGFLADYYARES